MSGSSAAFPIVGIGASAGGIEALEGFFRGLPETPGLGIVIVTHLSPERESILHEIIGRYTQLQVHVATDNVQIQLDNVYVLPADAILDIRRGHLFIHKPNKARRERKPIDIFFSALAADQGETAVGIVLSGGDSDGTLGVKAIKERGGFTLAQVADGYGPHYPDMPASAISGGFVDLALPVDEMGVKLVEFARSLPELEHIIARADETPDNPALKEARREIYSILRNQIGHDFSGYKDKTFLRRVQRRMQVTQLETIDSYIELLRQQPQEVGALFRDLLINVTNFFRDADAFDKLAAEVIPQLFEGRGADETIRIWVPGCSTGEEVFSLGILMREHMETLTAIPRIQIFATDIDERALGVARAARYPAALLDSVSEQRRGRYFIPEGGSYVVSKEIRDLCIFSPHSVIRDPPFSRIDLVSCRNLLIYFGIDTQNQVIPTFHYALLPDGFLFLGTAENISQFDDLFAPIDKKHRIFRRRTDGVPSVRLPLVISALRAGQAADLRPRRVPVGSIALRQAVDAQVIERFAPPHVVVSREGDVVYYSARTGKYLEAAPGAPSRQITTMARRGLRLELRTVFREVVDTGQMVVRENVGVESDDGRVQMIRLTAEPMTDRNGGEPLYLILFTDEGPLLSREEALSRSSSLTDGTAVHLDHELRETRERLQSIVEEYETALEELKSSNEELVSVNEELQSTNEELEASKEELQSVNEELHTVNTELSGKVEALDLANNDLQNLFESTDVATIFLDHNLCIRSFTPAVAEIFNILPSDRGRPITDLSSQFNLPSFAGDIVAVLGGGNLIERRIDHRKRQLHYLLRIAPYRDGGETVEGVVVTFVDITGLIEAEARQSVLIAELQHRTRNLLAVVQSIAQRTLTADPGLEAFNDRLAAIGRVQNLISQAVNEAITLREIMEVELAATGVSETGKIVLDGPPVTLKLEATQTFALVVHELATNALKYGALKHETGRLNVTWRVEDDANRSRLVLKWKETGVPMPTVPTRSGYGRELIEKALRFTLRAHGSLSFTEEGVVCRIEMPLR